MGVTRVGDREFDIPEDCAAIVFCPGLGFMVMVPNVEDKDAPAPEHVQAAAAVFAYIREEENREKIMDFFYKVLESDEDLKNLV